MLFNSPINKKQNKCKWKKFRLWIFSLSPTPNKKQVMKQIFFIYIFTITKQINKNKEPPPKYELSRLSRHSAIGSYGHTTSHWSYATIHSKTTATAATTNTSNDINMQHTSNKFKNTKDTKGSLLFVVYRWFYVFLLFAFFENFFQLSLFFPLQHFSSNFRWFFNVSSLQLSSTMYL